MLGSNPSARAMAGHQQEHLLLTGAPVPQEFQLMFCPQSDKPMQPETYKISKNYEEPRAVCHLAIFTGLDDSFAAYQGLRAPRSTPGYFMGAPLGRRAHISKRRNLGNDKIGAQRKSLERFPKEQRILTGCESLVCHISRCSRIPSGCAPLQK
jgi:hypothetical protein